MEEEIFGTIGDDTLEGTNGNDTFTGFSGNDTINGGQGTDTAIFYGTHADYIITQNADGSWTIRDTEEAVDNQGEDTLINIEQLTFTRTGTFTPEQLLALQTTEDQTITGTDAPEDVSGSLGDDTLSGGAGSDSVYGGPGNDRLSGGRGNDFINGGIGIDTLILTGSFANYSITRNDDVSVIITDLRTGAETEGEDIVANVETVEFESGESISIADWLQGSTPLNLIADIAGQTQFITGTNLRDAFVIDANSTDYGWGETADGNGIVVWSGAEFDILNDVEQLNFNDGIVEQQADGSFTFTTNEPDEPTDDPDDEPTGELNLINDITEENQSINGTVETDVFVIDGTSTDYGWGATNDGNGLVIWRGDNFDILNNIEQIRFNNGTLSQNEDGSYSFTVEAGEDSPETGFNLIADTTENQFITGLERPDIFTIDGLSTDYGWGETGDGEGIVVWQGDAFDILNGVEQLRFNDGTLSQLADDTFVFASNEEIIEAMGTAANETISGGNANDILNGASGNDSLTGGAGLDLFQASLQTDNDTITDFEDGIDLIDFTLLAGTVDSFEDLNITENGGNALVSFENGSFTLNGVEADTLTFNDFLFA